MTTQEPLSICYLLLKESEPLFRRSAFSYECSRCGRCCMNTLIRLNAFELARLAAAKKLSVVEFTNRYTNKNGAEILRDSKGHCPFLSDKGCDVYDNRPLVCRLYPLCRNSQTKDGEAFRILDPVPGATGTYGTKGTVDDYLDKQCAEEFIVASDEFMETRK